MNRHQRRKMIGTCMETAAPNGKSLMEMLRDARPTLGYKTRPTALTPGGGLSYAIAEFEVSDYSWINAVTTKVSTPTGRSADLLASRENNQVALL